MTGLCPQVLLAVGRGRLQTASSSLEDHDGSGSQAARHLPLITAPQPLWGPTAPPSEASLHGTMSVSHR